MNIERMLFRLQREFVYVIEVGIWTKTFINMCNVYLLSMTKRIIALWRSILFDYSQFYIRSEFEVFVHVEHFALEIIID